jgi:tRNA (guanine-N7-)-methyltransferase
VGKSKLIRFAEMETFDHVVQPDLNQVLGKDYKLKGKWASDFFKNDKPIVLELGCGKGEYAVSLARNDGERNYLGIDIKGARMWRGAKTALEDGIMNVGFLRTRIEFISSFFNSDEVAEIWITFPDPQLKERRAKKRLTSTGFLEKYRSFLKADGVVNLKTDSRELYDYTSALIELNELSVLKRSHDLYNSPLVDDVLSIRTFYESQFLEQGKKITYLQFRIDTQKMLTEPDLD